MKISLIFLIFTFFFYFTKPLLHAKIENQIILKVENEIITNYEIKNKILTTLILSNQRINQENINKLKKQALEFLIQNKLRKIELAKHNFKRDNAEINSYLQSISNNDVGSLKDKFDENNISYELFLEEIEIQLKWQKLIFKIFSNKIQIDENSIEQEVKSILKSQSEIVEFKISEIEILLDNNNNDEQKISNILSQIETVGFEETALKFSVSSTATKGGDLGWVNSQSLSKDIYKAIGNLKIGEISAPIKKQNTALFLKLKDKKISKAKNVNFDELKKNLVNQKRNELFNLYSRSYLSKLKNNSLIQYVK